MDICVIIPTHNPHRGRLQSTLESLRKQTLPFERWEILIVDNASTPALQAAEMNLPSNARMICESETGLSWARRRGLRETTAPICIFADDDNILDPAYLEKAWNHMSENPRLGATGGKSLPRFESEPASWTREFHGLLALRDLGSFPLTESWSKRYPDCSPIGAGMVLRKAAAKAWLEQEPARLPDRQGDALSSGGDNDIVLSVLKAGWQAGYHPDLVLTHLIPAFRLQAGYLARLNRGIQKSWMQVLTLHGVNPWPVIPGWTIFPRQLKAWISYRAWSSPAAHIRWQGACGHFEGRAASLY